MIPINARIRHVERPGAKDRYGQPIHEVVASMVDVRLDRSTRQSWAPDGRQVTKDATLDVEYLEAFQAGDVLTLDVDEDERYNVVDVRDHAGIDGVVIYRTYGLTRRH